MTILTSQKSHRVIGFVLLTLGAMLFAFSLYLLGTVFISSPLWQKDPQTSLVSIPVPFALVFLYIGWRSLNYVPDRTELMPLYVWRRLANVLLFAGIFMAVVYHWYAFIFPAVIAGLCYMTDRSVYERLIWLWPF